LRIGLLQPADVKLLQALCNKLAYSTVHCYHRVCNCWTACIDWSFWVSVASVNLNSRFSIDWTFHLSACRVSRRSSSAVVDDLVVWGLCQLIPIDFCGRWNAESQFWSDVHVDTRCECVNIIFFGLGDTKPPKGPKEPTLGFYDDFRIWMKF